MIAKFFNKSAPINMLTIVILLVFMFLLTSISLDHAQFSWDFFSKRLTQFLLIGLTFFLVNFIVRKNDLTKENTFVLFLLICCIGLFPYSTANSEYLIIHLILLLAFRRLYSLKSIKQVKEKLFDAAFWIGIISLINPICVLYLFLVYASIIFNKKFTPRNVFIPIVGFTTPVFIYGVYLFYFDQLESLLPSWNYDFSLYNYNAIKFILALTLLVGFLIWTVIPTTVKILTAKTELKNTWYLIFVHLILSLVFVISIPDKNGSELLFLFFPVVVIFANYLQQVNESWFKEVFLYLFFVCALLINML